MSTKKEFLDSLAEELRYLPAAQVNKVLKHYRDKIDVEIDYGIPEEKVIDNLKTPEAIAKNIYEMHGVDYLKKRKKSTKIKNILSTIVCVLLLLACIALLIFGSVFIWKIIINMASLIIHAFTFTSVLDIILTSVSVLGYLVVMIIAYIYILDLFIILTNELLIKILNYYDKTRGVTYPFMDFSFTSFFNEKTKKPKFLLRVLGIGALVFLVCGFSSIMTKGYFYRSFKDIPNFKLEQEISEKITSINIKSNEIKIEIKTNTNIDKPKLEYEYEFDKMHYEINNGVLEITNDSKKTYDLFNLIKSPTSKLIVYIPKEYDTNKINIDVNYGDVRIDKIAVNELIVEILSGDFALVNSTINKTNVNIYTGQVVLSQNKIQEIEVVQKSGSYTSSNDEIKKFTHNNESTAIKMVNTLIDEYKLNNISGTIYLEKITGNKFEAISSTSVNELYDLNYSFFDYTIQATGKVTITRSKFDDLTVSSLGNSYQTLEYIKANNITLKAIGGLVVCENINCNYNVAQLDKLGDYREYGEVYNDYVVAAPVVNIISNKADVTLTNNEFKEFEFELDSAATSITDVTSDKIKMILHDIGAEFDNLYAPIIDIKLTSSSLTSSSKIEYMYEEQKEIILNLEMDGKSVIYYPEDNPNFKLNLIK